MATAVASPVIELWSYCPYLNCGEHINDATSVRFCGQCGAGYNVCQGCRATNRLLATYCRGCGKRMGNDAWPMYPGLFARSSARSTIQSLGEVNAPFPLRLDGEVIVSPVGIDGLIVVAHGQGSLTLLSEVSGEILGSVSVGQLVAVTPALHEGTLFVASGAQLLAFDLSDFLDQQAGRSIKILWNRQHEGEAIIHPVLVDDSAVYTFVRHGEQATLEATVQINGQPLWSEPPQSNSHLTAQPVLVNEFIILMTLAGEISLVNAATGVIQHTLTVGQNLDAQVSPYAVDNRVLFASVEGNVFELLIEQSGPIINHLYAHRAPIASLAASSEFVALGHMAGLTLLDGSGQLLWSNDTIESISEIPIIAGRSVFALDDTGNGLLFDVLRANPTLRRKMHTGWISAPPLLTRTRIVATSGDGKVTAIDWL